VPLLFFLPFFFSLKVRFYALNSTWRRTKKVGNPQPVFELTSCPTFYVARRTQFQENFLEGAVKIFCEILTAADKVAEQQLLLI